MVRPGVRCVTSTEWAIDWPSSILHAEGWEYAGLAANYMPINSLKASFCFKLFNTTRWNWDTSTGSGLVYSFEKDIRAVA